MSRSVFVCKPAPRDDSLVITTLPGLAERYPRYGFAKYLAVLRREGHTWNHKRVCRIYRQLQLNMRRKGARHKKEGIFEGKPTSRENSIFSVKSNNYLEKIEHSSCAIPFFLATATE